MVAPDRGSRGKEGEGSGDDLIPFADAQSLDGQYQSVRSGSAANGVGDAQVCGDLLFQFFDLGAHDVVVVGQHFIDGGLDVVQQWIILCMQVQHRDFHSKLLY